MTRSGSAADRLLRRRPDRARGAAGRLHGAGLRGRAGLPDPDPRARSSGSSIACSVRAPRSSRTGSPTRGPRSSSASCSGSPSTCCCALQGSLPFNPEGFGAAPWDVTFNTTTSFVTNTNWQFYGGETTMTYLSQMAGLAVQNFVSAAVGIAVLVAVIRGHRARGAQLARELLASTSPGRCSTSCCRSRCRRPVPRLPGRDPDAERLPSDSRTLTGGESDPGARARRPRRSRSSSSAPTAAGSSTSTPPSRSRTRPRSRTSSRWSSSS